MIRTIADTGDKSPGEVIRELRLARGISMRELSDMVGVDPSAISLWENGKRTPSVESFASVILALGGELIVADR